MAASMSASSVLAWPKMLPAILFRSRSPPIPSPSDKHAEAELSRRDDVFGRDALPSTRGDDASLDEFEAYALELASARMAEFFQGFKARMFRTLESGAAHVKAVERKATHAELMVRPPDGRARLDRMHVVQLGFRNRGCILKLRQ